MASDRNKSGDETQTIPIEVVVQSNIINLAVQKYDTTLPAGAVLLIGLKRLMDSNVGFSFTYIEYPKLGPYLESVNGVYGSTKNHTYWEFLVKEPSGKTIKPDVGIGCYIPSANEQIILNFTYYPSPWKHAPANEETQTIPIEVVVQSNIINLAVQKYDTTLPAGAVLLIGLKRLMDSNVGFRFTYIEYPEYGPFLESVNDVYGSKEDHTYWELLAKKPGGEITPLEVGIGCYIPSANEQIILNFTYYPSPWKHAPA